MGMFNLGADSSRANRPNMDRINISFKRFQLLRSIACAAKKHHSARVVQLLSELDTLEIRELVGAKINV